MASNTFDVEYAPMLSTDNTEVKVPVNVADEQSNAVCTESSANLSDVFPASQYVCGNSDDLYLQAFNKLISLYRDLPRDMFIASILQEYASDEQELDATRTNFFEFLKTHDDFPFPLNSDLKKRVFTRGRKETVAVKLATDIYSLLSVMEGDEYSVIKEMISVSKRRTFSHLPSSQGNPQPMESFSNARCKCNTELTVLRDTVSSIQAEVLLLKQSLHTSNHLRSEEMKNISDTLKGLKVDITRHTDNMKALTDEMASSTCEEMRALTESLSVSLDKRVSSIEKFLDGENIHVVSFVPDQNCESISTQADSFHTTKHDTCNINCSVSSKQMYETADHRNIGSTDQNVGVIRSQAPSGLIQNASKDTEQESLFMFGDVRIPNTSQTDRATQRPAGMYLS